MRTALLWLSEFVVFFGTCAALYLVVMAGGALIGDTIRRSPPGLAQAVGQNEAGR